MAKLALDFPFNLKTLKPNNSPQRRFSTGNSIIKISDQKPIPNYLKSSVGSCHDFCKYGKKRDFMAESISPKEDKTKSVPGMEVRSKADYCGKKTLVETKNSVPVPSRQQLKPKSLVRSHEQPNKTFLQSKKNVQKSRNDAGKRVTSVRVPSEKNTTSKSSSEMEKPVENCQNCTETCCENVQEKIIHVESNDQGSQNEDNNSTEFSSSPDKDSVSNDSPSRKVKINKGYSLEIENGEAGSKENRLRRVASDGEINRQKIVSTTGALRHQATEQKNTKPDSMNDVIEETASKLGNMSQSKVKALVDAFETLITIQDSECSSAYAKSV